MAARWNVSQSLIMHKGTILFLALLILAVAAGVWGWQSDYTALTKIFGAQNKERAERVALKNIDSSWKEYSNEEFGYTIKIPTLSLGDTWCYPEGESIAVETVVVENESDTFVGPAYWHYFEEVKETVDEEGMVHYEYQNCEKVTAEALIFTPDFGGGWLFQASRVKNEKEMEQAIRTRFGDSCKVGELLPTTQTGHYRVTIEGDGLEIEESSCFPNYIYHIRYYEPTQTLVSWVGGQACGFDDSYLTDGYHETDSVCFDEEMTNSFRFNTE